MPLYLYLTAAGKRWIREFVHAYVLLLLIKSGSRVSRATLTQVSLSDRRNRDHANNTTPSSIIHYRYLNVSCVLLLLASYLVVIYMYAIYFLELASLTLLYNHTHLYT